MVKRLSKAFFLDRDGVINKSFLQKGKPVAPTKLADFKIIKDVKKSLIYLKAKGYLTIIVSNQPDIRKGLLNKSVLKKMNRKLKEELKIDDIFICEHMSIDRCDCRKPKLGMILNAKKKWNIDLKNSYLIGDRWRDIYLANKLNIKCFYIDNNYKEKKPKKYNYKVNSLFHAIKILQKNEKIY